MRRSAASWQSVQLLRRQSPAPQPIPVSQLPHFLGNLTGPECGTRQPPKQWDEWTSGAQLTTWRSNSALSSERNRARQWHFTRPELPPNAYPQPLGSLPPFAPIPTLQHIWADWVRPPRMALAHYRLGSRRGVPMPNACLRRFPVCTRVVRWIPRLPAELPLAVTPYKHLTSEYASTRAVSWELRLFAKSPFSSSALCSPSLLSFQSTSCTASASGMAHRVDARRRRGSCQGRSWYPSSSRSLATSTTTDLRLPRVEEEGLTPARVNCV